MLGDESAQWRLFIRLRGRLRSGGSTVDPCGENAKERFFERPAQHANDLRYGFGDMDLW